MENQNRRSQSTATKTLMSNNSEICQATFLHMRDKWQSCVDVMPFFEFCASQFPAKKHFNLLEAMYLILVVPLRFAPFTRLKLCPMQWSPKKVF